MRMSTGTATYLYCLLRHAAPDPPAADGVPAGLPDASAPRLLAVQDRLWLVACRVPLAVYGEAALARHLEDLEWVSARALAHEAVVEHFIDAGALVPMKLFTLFASDERALAHVRGDRRLLEPILDRVAGREEWGVRVTYEPGRAARAAPAPDPAAAPAPASGRDFLLRKQRERAASRLTPASGREAADAAHHDLSARAAECRRRDSELGPRVLLDCAAAARRAVRTHADRPVATVQLRRRARVTTPRCLPQPGPRDRARALARRGRRGRCASYRPLRAWGCASA
jgi:hypothetical protein